MKFAATILYEDQFAVDAREFSLHVVVTQLVADELNEPLHRCRPALDGRPMKGVDKVLDALLKHAGNLAPNGRQLVGCVDSDVLDAALQKRSLLSIADVSVKSGMPAKVKLLPLAHNTEALLKSVASITGTDLRGAISSKNRMDRDLVFKSLIGVQPAVRTLFRKQHQGVDALVSELAPRVVAWLRRGNP